MFIWFIFIVMALGMFGMFLYSQKQNKIQIKSESLSEDSGEEKEKDRDKERASEWTISETDKLIASCSYLGPLCIYPLLSSHSKFISFHARQGLMIFIFESALFILGMLPLAGDILRIIAGIVFISSLIYGLYLVWHEKLKKFPGIDQLF